MQYDQYSKNQLLEVIRSYWNCQLTDASNCSMQEASYYFRKMEALTDKIMSTQDEQLKSSLSCLAAYKFRDTAYQTIIKMGFMGFDFDHQYRERVRHPKKCKQLCEEVKKIDALLNQKQHFQDLQKLTQLSKIVVCKNKHTFCKQDYNQNLQIVEVLRCPICFTEQYQPKEDYLKNCVNYKQKLELKKDKLLKQQKDQKKHYQKNKDKINCTFCQLISKQQFHA